MNLKKSLLLLLLISLFNEVYGQDYAVDSLKFKTFDELENLVFENLENKVVSGKYAEIYLEKAKKNKDSVKMAYGYMYKSYSLDYDLALKYGDSTILLTKNIENNKFPAVGYMLKGYYYYKKGLDKKAISYYFKAKEFALSRNNLEQLTEIEQFIAIMKSNVGDYKEALNINLNELKRLEKHPDTTRNYVQEYEITLNSIGKSYLRQLMLDSAERVVQKGIKYTHNRKYSRMYSSFLLDASALFYFKEEYSKALDSLKKVEPMLKGTSLSVCYYYQGKIFQTKNLDSSVTYFRKIDSIYAINKDPYIDLKDVYRSLTDYYAKNNDTQTQLIYI